MTFNKRSKRTRACTRTHSLTHTCACTCTLECNAAYSQTHYEQNRDQSTLSTHTCVIRIISGIPKFTTLLATALADFLLYAGNYPPLATEREKHTCSLVAAHGIYIHVVRTDLKLFSLADITYIHTQTS